jgi:predicted GH43/DUF377 family glycosyl hydrolase
MKNIISLSLILLILVLVGRSTAYSNNINNPADTPVEGETVIDTLARTQWDQYSGNPIIKPEASGWNQRSVLAPTVIMFKDTLRMWYMGSTSYGFDGIIHIGYAWSLDGITWQQYSENPVFSPRQGKWDYPHIGDPHVIADGDTLRMWYGGGDMTYGYAQSYIVMRIGYATSVDCINWNRHPEPVIEPPHPPAWDQDGVLPGGVIKEDGIFKMWFSGGVGRYGYPPASSKWSIGYATSSDCIHWDLLPDPVITHGDSSTDFDETIAAHAYVTRTNAGYDMWYHGHSQTAVASGRPQAKIGYASSSDGIHWTKYYKNPVLNPTAASPHWTTGYYTPSVLFDGERFHIWFTGWTEGRGMIAIGYATSVPDTSHNTTGIEDDLIKQVPGEYKLFQNYPNPFNPSTIIKYSIPYPSFVTLRVYDILGREVASLVNKREHQGLYEVQFDSNNLASGLYFYRITAGKFVDTKRLMILK